MARRRNDAPLPTREQLLAFFQENPQAVSRSDVVRAFRIAPADRRDLSALIRELEDEGLIARGEKRRFIDSASLPEVGVLAVSGTDEDGEVLLRPEAWRAETDPPVVRLAREARRFGPAPATGDRILARVTRVADGSYEARIIRRLPGRPRILLGVYRTGPGGGRIQPTDRRIKNDLMVSAANSHGAQPCELVLAQPVEGFARGAPRARVTRRLGDANAPGAFSLIAIHEAGIPDQFPPAALREAEAARPAPMAARDDLRDVPLVTIDDEDARDFDDAVFAEPDADPANTGGFHLVVAIADVGWYVRPAGALDRSAAERGNSVYFPDRVVPMLPERLSNDLCSLRPNEDRPVLAVHLWIDAEGRKRRHRFVRAMMRSAARLTYRQIQNDADGLPADGVPEGVRAPLYAAYHALRRARQARGTLDLDLPERRIVMNDQGRIESVAPRARYDSHRLIEEFMILANVAAAEALEENSHPVMYRVHEAPSPEKLEALRAFLASLDLSLSKGQVMQARHFERILARAAQTPHSRIVNEMILRSQAQASYHPENVGHFGLALRRYCHFTSPIRRYADLLVHRALISGFGLGEGGLAGADEAARFGTLARQVSMTERRAAAAERDTADRLVAAFLAQSVGATFEGRIQGVTRFGLFVHLEETDADGLLPISSLGAERFRHDEARHTLTGERSRIAFALGDPISVRLEEANPLTGRILFSLAASPPPRPRGRGETSRGRGPSPGRRPGPSRGRRGSIKR